MTVWQKLLNTFGWIFDACLIGFFHKTAETHTSFAYSWSTSKECKISDAVVPDALFAANEDTLVIKWKNIKIQCWFWFCIVGAVFNTTTMWYFQYLCVLLRKNQKMLFVFPHFIMSVTQHVNCDIGSRQENGVLEILIGVGTFSSTSSFNTQHLQFVKINKLTKVYVPGGL